MAVRYAVNHSIMSTERPWKGTRATSGVAG